MSREKKFLLVFLALVLALLLPMTASATSLKYRARLTAAVDTDTYYGDVYIVEIDESDSLRFDIHLHQVAPGPIDRIEIQIPQETHDITILLLCGPDDLPDLSPCEYGPQIGEIQGEITPALLAEHGMTPTQFLELMASLQLVVSVYLKTDGNRELELDGQRVDAWARGGFTLWARG